MENERDQIEKRLIEELEEEDRKEVRQFMAEHGLVPIGERALSFLEKLSGEERKRFEQNEMTLAPFEEELRGTEEVSRLNGLYQLGGKTIPNDGEDPSFVARPAFHSRHDHSELIALYAKIVGARINVPVEKIKILVAAAWLHDIGHSAFSHTGDRLLDERGVPSHEERSLEKIKTSEGLMEILQGVDMPELMGVIKENNSLGYLQSVLDTISYLEMDSKMIKSERGLNDSDLIFDAKGVDEKTGSLIVGDPELWQEMIDTRSLMMKDVYYNRKNKISEEALRQLLRLAIREGEISEEDLINGTDTDLRLKLQSLVQNDSGAAVFSGRSDMIPRLKVYKDLYTLSLGFEPDDDWREIECDTKEEALAILGKKDPGIIESSFIVSPYDYTKKQLRIRKEGAGKEEETTVLKAKGELSAEERKYIVYFKA